MSDKGKFYMTTAIAYTSGKPHIGNTYEIVLADAIARYKRLEGYDVYLPDRNRRAWPEDRGEGRKSRHYAKGVCRQRSRRDQSASGI